jgi:hypothetical protein
MTDAYNSSEDKHSERRSEGDDVYGTRNPRSRSEAELILNDLETLRTRIIVAWQEKSVILSSEEQRDLRTEIQRTCELLRDLVGERPAGERQLPMARQVRSPSQN